MDGRCKIFIYLKQLKIYCHRQLLFVSLRKRFKFQPYSEKWDTFHCRNTKIAAVLCHNHDNEQCITFCFFTCSVQSSLNAANWHPYFCWTTWFFKETPALTPLILKFHHMLTKPLNDRLAHWPLYLGTRSLQGSSASKGLELSQPPKIEKEKTANPIYLIPHHMYLHILCTLLTINSICTQVIAEKVMFSIKPTNWSMESSWYNIYIIVLMSIVVYFIVKISNT